MTEKRRIVAATPELVAPLTELELREDSPVLLRSREYYQIGCDMRRLDILESSLSEVAPMAHSEFFFLSDATLTHVDAPDADSLIRE